MQPEDALELRSRRGRPTGWLLVGSGSCWPKAMQGREVQQTCAYGGCQINQKLLREVCDRKKGLRTQKLVAYYQGSGSRVFFKVSNSARCSKFGEDFVHDLSRQVRSPASPIKGCEAKL